MFWIILAHFDIFWTKLENLEEIIIWNGQKNSSCQRKKKMFLCNVFFCWPVCLTICSCTIALGTIFFYLQMHSGVWSLNEVQKAFKDILNLLPPTVFSSCFEPKRLHFPPKVLKYLLLYQIVLYETRHLSTLLFNKKYKQWRHKM
jgi:hypothetical protein